MSELNLLSPPLPSGRSAISWANLHGSATGLAIAEAAIVFDGLLMVVLDDPRQLNILESEIRFFFARQKEPQADDSELPILHFPSWECLPYDVFSPHQDITSDRLRLLANIGQIKRGILLTTSENLIQRLPPVDYVIGHTFSLQQGQSIDIGLLRDRLANANYANVSQVISAGEFAVRGA